jgi:hypothetical protein
MKVFFGKMDRWMGQSSGASPESTEKTKLQSNTLYIYKNFYLSILTFFKHI